MRAELIPAIVVLLQKQWRGAICRAKFRKMKAAYYIGLFYRRYKIRTYINSVLEAHKYVLFFLIIIFMTIVIVNISLFQNL